MPDLATTPPDVPPVPPAPPPPGTVALGFWQRSGTRTAVGTTAFVLMGFAHRYIAWKFGEEYAVAFDLVAGSWLVAAGISVVGGRAIREG